MNNHFAYMPLDTRTIQMRTGMPHIDLVITTKDHVICVNSKRKTENVFELAGVSRVGYFRHNLELLPGVKVLAQASTVKTEKYCMEILESFQSSSHNQALNA